MNIRLLLTFILVCAGQVFLNAQQVIIKLSDGNSERISLLSSPKIQFTSSEFLISTSDCEIRYPLLDVKGYYFIPAQPSDGVEESELSESTDYPIIKIGRDVISITGLTNPVSIEIFNQNGTKVLDKRIVPDKINVLSLQTLSSGIYIARIGNRSIKFLRK